MSAFCQRLWSLYVNALWGVSVMNTMLYYKLKKTENHDQYVSTSMPLIRADAHSIRVSRHIKRITLRRRPFLRSFQTYCRLSALDTGNIAMLTLSAEFDSVDHNTLLRQLRTSYCLSGKVMRLVDVVSRRQKATSSHDDIQFGAIGSPRTDLVMGARSA